MKRGSWPSAAMLILILTILAGPARMETFDYATGDRVTRMWLPDQALEIRGILIQGNGAGSDARRYLNNQAMRGFARLHHFAFIATGYWGNLSGVEIDLWEQHLDAFSVMSGHPELRHAPWLPLGFSNGGQMSYGFNALRPKKVIGFIANKGGYYNDPLPPEAALETPGILVAGELDTEFRRTAIRTIFFENRARGARWAWVEEQGMAHESDAERLLLPFMHECMVLRYPPDQVPTATSGVELNNLPEDSGWLADPSSWSQPLTFISEYDAYPGENRLAAWLPDAGTAFAYRAFATRCKWLEKTGFGMIGDRPLYIEVPDFSEYWHRIPAPAPVFQPVSIDTSEYPFWADVTFFSLDRPLLRIVGDGDPHGHAAGILELDSG
ncbi:hypothetical protein JW905_10190, partial [bacterium]|nr:hypothetical protein [candidate division CSSED10-310 bacterium]